MRRTFLILTMVANACLALWMAIEALGWAQQGNTTCMWISITLSVLNLVCFVDTYRILKK